MNALLALARISGALLYHRAICLDSTSRRDPPPPPDQPPTPGQAPIRIEPHCRIPVPCHVHSMGPLEQDRTTKTAFVVSRAEFRDQNCTGRTYPYTIYGHVYVGVQVYMQIYIVPVSWFRGII